MTNNIVINNVIDVNVVQKVTGKEVPTRREVNWKPLTRARPRPPPIR